MDQEKKFILNLIRLSGCTDAITIDLMFDSLSYINSNPVTEAQFIEGAYLGCIFADDDFLKRADILVCSLQGLIHKYDDAKRSSNEEFFSLWRKKHNEADAFLLDMAVQVRIRQLIIARKRILAQSSLAYDHKHRWVTPKLPRVCFRKVTCAFASGDNGSR
jgi:hypothetical protein